MSGVHRNDATSTAVASDQKMSLPATEETARSNLTMIAAMPYSADDAMHVPICTYSER